jgi:DNA (cytosine-5)-methyltransferase 1
VVRMWYGPAVPYTPTIGSLFSGYGGLDIAAENVLQGRTVWHCEIEPAARKVLAARWPGVPNLGDISSVDWTQVEPVDVLCGGFPCQDVSSAGKRAGMRAGTRSGLWAVYAEAIDVLRPQMVVVENVRGLLSAGAHSDVEPCPWCLGDIDGEPPLRALGAVLGDLADLGYDASWCGLHAADVGAPHGRYRIFLLAWPTAGDTSVRGRDAARPTRGRREPARTTRRSDLAAADATGDGWDERQAEPARQLGGPHAPVCGDAAWGAYAPAITRWAAALGRTAPAPTELAPRGGQRLSPRFVEWLMGLPAGWVTDVPGISRNEQLKMLGNGVVPQQAAAALRWLLDGSGL